MGVSQALHLSSHSVQSTSPENIIKLLAQDAQKFDQSLFAIHYIWLGPLCLSAVCVYLYLLLDSLAFIAGVLVIALLVLPVQAGMAKVFSIIRYVHLLTSKISLLSNYLLFYVYIFMYSCSLFLQ